MLKVLLESDRRGELNRVVQVVLGLLGLCIAAWLAWLVQQAIAPEARAARFAAAGLMLGAAVGYPSVLATMVKVAQGGRVRVTSSE